LLLVLSVNIATTDNNIFRKLFCFEYNFDRFIGWKMANYKQHLSGGILFGIICMVITFFLFGLSLVNSSVVLILSIMGSILPDIDSDTSKPVQILFETIAIIIPIMLIQFYFNIGLNLENMIFIVIAGYIIIKYGASFIFYKFTVHRGIIHSIPAAVIVACIIFLIFTDSSLYLRSIFALACSGGFLVHLIMDEIWSVDISSMKIKKSFGTALALRSNSAITTILAYLVIIAMFVYIYRNTAISEKQYNQKTEQKAVQKAVQVALNSEQKDLSQKILIAVNSNWKELYSKYF
jgi:membrane-bound metal-dependent hydrolase YbcI (DUF457 family)